MSTREPGPLEALLHERNSSFRRRLLAGGGIALAFLVGISIALAWRQYDDAKSRAMTDLEARAVGVSAIVDTSFAGQIATLNSIAGAPSVVAEQRQRMDDYFARVNPAKGGLFSGGLGWIDRDGRVGASSRHPVPKTNVSTRLYFLRVMTTGKPYVSAGLIGRRNKQPLIVVAVPTRDAHGRKSGVLVGAIILKTVAESQQARDLGYGNLQIVDRDGQLLLAQLRHVENDDLLKRIDKNGSGVVSNTRGLDGESGHVVAYATSQVPDWVTVIDRPRSTVFAAAHRALVLELASVAAGVLFVVGILVYAIRRSRRHTEEQNERARSWSGLTRALGSASTEAEVADALLSSLRAAFPGAVAIVAFEGDDGPRVRWSSRPGQIDAARVEKLAALAAGTAGTGPVPDRGSLKAIHSRPILGVDERLLGTIAVVHSRPRLETSEWSLLESFADQAARALEGVQLFAHEHQLAVRLQESLMPDRLPTADGVELAAFYLAGGQGVEVGGDWYDAVRRADGILQLCVGDVSGRGIDSAALMGRQRTTFRVYAQDHVSPAEIVRGMLRHASADELVTIACISLDPYTGELAYACAGHPPPILVDRASGTATLLDQASAPPLGVAEPTDVVEARLVLPERALLALYTDGLIERRGQDIGENIELLSHMLASEPGRKPAGIVSEIGSTIGVPEDDVALLLLGFDAERVAFDISVPADPSSLQQIRRRLRAWLAHKRIDGDEAADLVLAVSEACNNSIEHAYGDAEGIVTVRIEELDDVLRAVIADYGSWREAQVREERGRGIVLMQRLMDSAQHETGRNGTRVILEQQRRVRA